MKWLRKAAGRLGEQRGFTLLETVIALGILASIGVAFLTALNTTSRSTNTYEQRATALILAQSEIEEIKAMPYDATGNYPVRVTPPSDYSISISYSNLADGKQEITVAVSRNNTGVLKMTTIKTNL